MNAPITAEHFLRRALAPAAEFGAEAPFASPDDGDRILLTGLSSAGLRANGAARLTPGTDIRVEMPGLGAVDCQVKWVDGDRFGAEFTGRADLRRLFLSRLPAPHPTRLRKAA